MSIGLSMLHKIHIPAQKFMQKTYQYLRIHPLIWTKAPFAWNFGKTHPLFNSSPMKYKKKVSPKASPVNCANFSVPQFAQYSWPTFVFKHMVSQIKDVWLQLIVRHFWSSSKDILIQFFFFLIGKEKAHTLKTGLSKDRSWENFVRTLNDKWA